jgi:hypothetical protein
LSEAIKELTSLNLYEIIAGPLIAIIEAEAQAAKTTLEYIEKVGFVEASSSEEKEGEIKVGKLRMAEFTYKKPDENGKLVEFTASVPVLSLVPVPAIQVKKAKVSFSAKITDVETVSAKTSMSKNPETKQKWLLPQRTELRASMGTRPTKDEKRERVYQMDIDVIIEQADVSVGLMKVFNMMDQAIQDRKAAK